MKLDPCLAVVVDFIQHSHRAEADRDEILALVSSAGAEIAEVISYTRLTPESRYLVGHGKALAIAAAVSTHAATLVVVNHALSPAQERNLERLCCCRVLDRTRLILDIFAIRARTFEGKLQVELAQLRHLSTRLVRGWTHSLRAMEGPNGPMASSPR